MIPINRQNLQLVLEKMWAWFLNGLNPLHNFWLKFISLTLAFLALYFVGGEKLVQDVDVSLYLTLPQEIATVEEVQDTATVKILASNAVLNSLQPNQVFFDFKDLEFQEGELFINLENKLRTPPGVEIIKITPATLRLILEPKVQKRVPIQPKLQGTPPRNFDYIRYEMSRSKVLVEGAKSIIENLAEIETEPISLANRSQTFTTEAPLVVGDLNINLIEKEPIMLTVQIVKQPLQKILRNIPVQVKSPPARFQYNPKSISATFLCNQEIIEKIEKKNIRAFIDLSNIKTLNRQIRVPLQIDFTEPETKQNCRVRYLSQRQIDVFITKYK